MPDEEDINRASLGGAFKNVASVKANYQYDEHGNKVGLEGFKYEGEIDLFWSTVERSEADKLEKQRAAFQEQYNMVIGRKTHALQ